jgi:atypical dual specificity phosphatase
MKKKVLVHCAAGISRSSTLVIAYLINCENMKLFDAFKHVRSKRGVIWPNTGFMKMLIEMEFKIYKKNTMNI